MIYKFTDCELDDALYQLRRGGEVVAIEPQVFRLLAYLLTHRDRVVSRDELFAQLWPGQVVSDAALTYCIGKARKAVDDTGTAQRVIKTVHGHGYRLIAQVICIEALAAMYPSAIALAQESQQRPLLASTHPALSPAVGLAERTIVVAPLGSWSRQSRQLTLVGCLFVCGWIASLWQISMQSPWNTHPWPATPVLGYAEVPQAEDLPCQWWARATHNPSAREALFTGWNYASRSTGEAKTEARWLFQRAIDLDPTYAAAYASLGVLAWQDWHSWSHDAKSLEQASLYLQKAAALDSSCPQLLTLLSKVLFRQRRQAQAVAEAERQLYPAPLSFPVESSSAPQISVRK